MALFLSSLAEEAFYAVYLVWFAFTFFIERMIIGEQSREKVRRREDRGSALLIWLSVFVSIFVAFGFAGASVAVLPDWTFYAGVFLMILGIVVREWAVTTLRSYFSFRVRVLEEHKVVEDGPYRAVRHPAYTGSILTIVGLGLALRSWGAVLVLLLFCSIGYGYRIRVEEKTLLGELGDEYARYMSRTKRLIPLIL